MDQELASFDGRSRSGHPRGSYTTLNPNVINKNLSLRKVINASSKDIRHQRSWDQAFIPSAVENSFHIKRNFKAIKPKVPSPIKMYPKDELLQMIYGTDQKGKLLTNASPMVNVAESIHGALVAHTVLGTASLPTVPLGSVNEDE